MRADGGQGGGVVEVKVMGNGDAEDQASGFGCWVGFVLAVE